MPEIQKEKIIKIQSRKHIASLFQGAFHSHFHGRGVEFRDFREYHPDDDAKYIDWTVSSREGEVIMRRYREEKQGNIFCAVDISENSEIFFQEKKKVFSSLISLLGNATLSSGDNFGGYIFGEKQNQFIPANKRRENISNILYSLEQTYCPKAPNVSQLLVNNMKKSIIFYLTDRIEIDEKKYKALALKHDVIYVYISSHFENTLDGGGIRYLTDGGNDIFLNLDNQAKKNLYIKKRNSQITHLGKKLQNIDISFLSLDEQSDIYIELLNLIRLRQGNRYV